MIGPFDPPPLHLLSSPIQEEESRNGLLRKIAPKDQPSGKLPAAVQQPIRHC